MRTTRSRASSAVSLAAGEVVLGGDVVFQRGDVDQALREVGAEVEDLERTDDGIEPGKLKSEGGEVELLDLDAGVGGDGGKQGLELLEPLAVGVLLRGGLQDQAEVLAQAALDGVVEREIEDVVPVALPETSCL